jgi:excisionase family DNA binding protein
MGKRLVGIKEAAEYLDISVNTLYTWVSQKRIPYVKMGRLVKFDLETLDRFISSNAVEENKNWPFGYSKSL